MNKALRILCDLKKGCSYYQYLNINGGTTIIDKKVLKKASSFQLNKTSQEIDDYFQKGKPKPKRKR